MRLEVLLGVLAVSVTALSSVAARAADPEPGQGGVPTVIIINKSAADSVEPAPPELTVNPAAPEVAREGFADEPAAQPAGEEAATNEAHAAGSTEPERSEAAPTDAASAGHAAGEEVAPPLPPEPTLAIDIDLTRQVMTVAVDGVQTFTWPVSSARYGYRTPTGTFQPTWMSKMWYSRQYDYAPMPHAVFFHKGVAIHATYATRMLGRPASHGCVRLAPRNAATLYALVNRHGKERTQIVVHGTPNHSSEARIASRERDAVPMRRASQYRYLPPAQARRAYAYGPPPGYAYYPPPRSRRAYAPPRRQPRGLFSSSSYGYGF